jgi:hypothetical protein
MANRSLFERVREYLDFEFMTGGTASPYRAGVHLHCVASSEPPVVSRRNHQRPCASTTSRLVQSHRLGGGEKWRSLITAAQRRRTNAPSKNDFRTALTWRPTLTHSPKQEKQSGRGRKLSQLHCRCALQSAVLAAQECSWARLYTLGEHTLRAIMQAI